MTHKSAASQAGFAGLEPSGPPPPEYAGRARIARSYDNRSTLTKASGFIKDYDYSLNPYSGCAFGCQYCYAAAFVSEKPDKDRSPSPYRRENWGEWIRVKKNAVQQVAAAVRKGELNDKSAYMSTVTDPYQPTERHTGQTNKILQELAKAKNLGLVLQTRGPLADNDADIALCRQIVANSGKVQVNMTITTNDEAVRRACEPTCPSYRQRLNAIVSIDQKVRDTEGYTTCITMTPLLPTADPEGFAKDLVVSGIQRFIIQPTHTGRINLGRFRAATRNEIVESLSQYWQCDSAEVRDRYRQNFDATRAVILPALESNGALVGFGQPGFGLPWNDNWHRDQSQRK